jgi:aryl-alcohol dehydrogenase-like predicted oxidoreductase
MKTVELGRTGERVGQLGLGCMLMGTLTDESSSMRMLNRFVDAGGTFLDTADCYAWWPRRGCRGGESEELLGRWFAGGGRRDDVFLATKGGAAIRDLAAVWGGDGDEPDWELARRSRAGAGGETLRRAIDGSLRRLGIDYVDLYYVHIDDRSTPLEETLEALAGIVQAGKARYIGWSNVITWRLERIRQLCARYEWPSPVALQQQHTYLRQRPGSSHHTIVTHEQLDYLRTHDDLTLVLYASILKGIYNDPFKRRDHWAMAPFRGSDSDARFAALDEVAAEHGATPNQLVLAWLLHQTSPAMVPLTTARTEEQYAATMPALDIQLTDEQLARLDDAGT